jgi:hypothetical protein
MLSPARDFQLSSNGAVAKRPGRLWSLWEMLNLLFGVLYQRLENVRLRIRILESESHLEPKFFENTCSTLSELRKDCEELQFEQSCHHIDRIVSALKRKHDTNYATIQLKDLLAAIEAEGKDDNIYHVPRDRAKLLLDEPNPWSHISEKFPDASDDIWSSITCYMYDENTASVFHSMRVLEYGLRALAEAVNLTFDVQQWQTIIEQIEAQIRDIADRWPAGNSKKEWMQFYSSAAKEFMYFKDGWRNHVSHNRAKYDAPQALSVLEHVKVFMTVLSGRLGA